MRLPVYDLTGFLPQILEGILLWAEDSKNKFRAKVGLRQFGVATRWVARVGDRTSAGQTPTTK